MKRAIWIAAGMLGAMAVGVVAAPAVKEVLVVNPMNQPVPVTPIGIGGTLVQGATTLVVPAGEFSDVEPLFEPPPGKSLVIEYVTIAVDGRNVEEQGVVAIRTRLNGSTVLHRLGPIPPLLRTGLGSGFGQEFQRNVRLYSDDTADVLYQRGTGFDTERAIIQITYSGHLVPTL